MKIVTVFRVADHFMCTYEAINVLDNCLFNYFHMNSIEFRSGE